MENAYIFCLQIKGYLGKFFFIRFLKINQIYTSHIPRILIRFITKPNIGIVTFIDILIVRHHIPNIKVVESYPSNAADKLDNMLLSNHGVLPHLKGKDVVKAGSTDDAINTIA